MGLCAQKARGCKSGLVDLGRFRSWKEIWSYTDIRFWKSLRLFRSEVALGRPGSFWKSLGDLVLMVQSPQIFTGHRHQ